MKILQLVHRFPPSVGGSQFYAYRIAQETAKLGHHVDVATTTSLTPLDTVGVAARGLIVKSHHPDLPTQEKDHQLTIYRFVPQAQLYTYLFTPDLRAWLGAHLGDYDLVHAHGYTFLEPYYALLARSGSRPKLVLSGHDLTQPHQNRLLKLVMGWYNHTRGRTLLKGYDRLIAHTQHNKQDYEHLGVDPHKIEVIPSGVDYGDFRFDPYKKTTGLELIFVGRLVAYKGAQYLLQAVAQLRGEYPQIHATIIGEDQGYGAALHSLAEQLDLGSTVTFAGKVTDTQLVRLLQDAHYFVFPSVNEGFGLVALQAIAAGCYPILAQEKSLKYLLADIGGSPIRFDEPQRAARDIAQAIRQKPWSERISEIATMQDLVQRQYSWRGVTRQIVDVYQAVLKQ